MSDAGRPAQPAGGFEPVRIGERLATIDG